MNQTDQRTPRSGVERLRYEREQRARRSGLAATILLSLLAGGLLTFLIVMTVGRGWISLPTPTPAPAFSLFPTPGPTPTPKIITGPSALRQIQQLSRLETTSYSVQSVITVERPGNVLGIGRQKVLIIVHGTVVAGIDLTKLKLEDVTVSPDGKRITVRLPSAEILSRYLDESRTQLYDHQTGILTQPDSSLVVEAQKAGASEVLQVACRDGIMQRATNDSRRAIEQVLIIAGFEAVEFVNTPVPSCPANATPAATPKA
jgi:hypothetical protein